MPKNLVICLALKKLKFMDLKGTMISWKYFLKNAEVLNKIPLTFCLRFGSYYCGVEQPICWTFKLKIRKSTTETMTSVSKHLQPLKEVNIGHGEDRISSLPDSLLIYILSFIPTKFAFRTTVLSKRWKDLWAFVPNLDFDGSMLDAPMQTPDYDKSFMNFVTKVFFFHRSPCIKRFHLKDGGGIDVSRVHTWISVLTARGVEEVDIEMYTRQDLILPQKLFCCKTLVVLKLINELKFNFPTSVYLPNLKILHVSLHYPENDITQKLFTSCPMLEDLHLRANVVDESEMIFDVSSPALKKLKFHLITFLECEHFDRGMKLSKNKIVVNAPVLEHLTVRDDYLPCYSLNNLSLLVRAYINVGHCCIELLGTKEHANKLFMLLEGITSVKFLSLAAATMGALEFADDYKLPLYPNLTNLELAVHNNYSWRRLPDLLDCVPKLKTLTLLKDPSCDKNGAKYDFDWIEPLREMPSCFSFLEEIRFSGFKGDDDEFKLLKYFLENTEALNMVRINFCNLTRAKERKFFKNIRKFRRASKLCEIDLFCDSKE
ncbi:hypothetical protein ACSBR2_033714 [Camellia fascicularis]